MVQLGLAMLACVLGWVSRRGLAVLMLVGAMLLITLGLAVHVVPETVRLGLLMDFTPAGSLPQVERMFWTLHVSYTVLDTLKFILGLAAAGTVWRQAATRLTLPGPT